MGSLTAWLGAERESEDGFLILGEGLDHEVPDGAFGGPGVALDGSIVGDGVLLVQFSQLVEVLINGLPATFEDLASADCHLDVLVSWTFLERMPKANTQMTMGVFLGEDELLHPQHSWVEVVIDARDLFNHGVFN